MGDTWSNGLPTFFEQKNCWKKNRWKKNCWKKYSRKNGWKKYCRMNGWKKYCRKKCWKKCCRKTALYHSKRSHARTMTNIIHQLSSDHLKAKVSVCKFTAYVFHLLVKLISTLSFLVISFNKTPSLVPMEGLLKHDSADACISGGNSGRLLVRHTRFRPA